MENKIIFDTTKSIVLAVAADSKTAHLIAETLSYVANGNAVYGLFGIQIVNWSELASLEGGPAAWNKFNTNL